MCRFLFGQTLSCFGSLFYFLIRSHVPQADPELMCN